MTDDALENDENEEAGGVDGEQASAEDEELTEEESTEDEASEGDDSSEVAEGEEAGSKEDASEEKTVSEDEEDEDTGDGEDESEEAAAADEEEESSEQDEETAGTEDSVKEENASDETGDSSEETNEAASDEDSDGESEDKEVSEGEESEEEQGEAEDIPMEPHAVLEATEGGKLQVFSLTLADGQSKPYANYDYELFVGDKHFKEKTNNLGKLQQEIPDDSKEARLVLWLGKQPDGKKREWIFEFHTLPPATSIAGARIRLYHMGYLNEKPSDSEELDGVTRNAIYSFQIDNKIEPTGSLDESTLTKISEYYQGPTTTE